VNDGRRGMNNTRDQLKQYIIASGQSQAVVAKEIRVSEAALSQFLSETYNGNNEVLCKKVKAFIQKIEKNGSPLSAPGFIVTSIVKEIWYAVKYAHMNHDIALIYGDAGRGKSIALREYAAKHAGVIYIEADATTQNTKAILEEIWKAIGKRNPEPERYMKEGIIDELRDTGRLIIIDEANQLNHKALEAIRALHDKGNMGIVLAGNSIIYERINSRNDTLYAQIVCRIGIRKHIFGKIAKSDIESLFEQKNFPLDARIICIN
jgi:DNA transposition AAA+ family ATPase